MTTATAAKRYIVEKHPIRGAIATGLALGDGDGSKSVDRTGGKFGNGVIHSPAVITRGEALGHYFWIDTELLSQVADEINSAGTTGIKSRLGHPDWNNDRTGGGLGRIVGAKLSGDIVRAGGLHLSRSASKSPDGDLADWVLTQAEEDPAAFGLSAMIQRDYEAEIAFLEEHGATWKEDWFGRYLDLDSFVSPDPLNTDNLPHARLAKLRGIDVVDSPAANPDGMLSETQLNQSLMNLPDVALREAFSREFRRRGFTPSLEGDLSMITQTTQTSKLKEDRNNPTASTPATPAAPPATETPAAPPVNPVTPETPAVPETPPATETPAAAPVTEAPTAALSSAQQLVKQYTDRFGTQGLTYLSAGLSLDQAQGKFNAELVAQNKELTEKLSAVGAAGGSLGDPTGVSHSPPEGTAPAKKQNGLTGLSAALAPTIRMTGKQPAKN